MTAVAIEAIGAFTPVGRNAPETMGSLICRVQLFDDLDVLGPDGEPITGAMTPIPRRISGMERLMALAFYAIEECAATISPDRAVPLVLAAPESSELGEGGAEALLTRLSAEPSLRIDARASQVLAQGRDGVSLAIERARQIVLRREAPACFLAGVDSFVGPGRVKRLLEEGRVRCGPNLDGFKPGEAAACLLLSPATASPGSALLAGLGLAEEHGSWTGDPPVTGQGLGRAFKAALAEAGRRGANPAYVAHDVSGEQAAFEELSFALGRLPPQPERPEIWGPASCTGEIGAAAGLLSLAMLAFYVETGVLTRPALASLVSEGRRRAAAVIAPAEPT